MRRRTKSRWGEGKRWRGRRVVLGKRERGKEKGEETGPTRKGRKGERKVRVDEGEGMR